MAKGTDARKETKKEPTKSLKEKRAEKKAKKAEWTQTKKLKKEKSKPERHAANQMREGLSAKSKAYAKKVALKPTADEMKPSVPAEPPASTPNPAPN
mgnify:CR=1 FL=1